LGYCNGYQKGIKRVSRGIKEENEVILKEVVKFKNWAADGKEKKRMWFDSDSFILLRARGRLTEI
jgi:hypothetical protein